MGLHRQGSDRSSCREVVRMTDIQPYLPLLTVATAVIGWFVIIRATRKNVSRGETHSLMQMLFGVVDKMEADARKYWLDNAANWNKDQGENYVSSVVDTIENVRMHGEFLRRRGHDFVLHSDLRDLRRQLTLNAENLPGESLVSRIFKINETASTIRDFKTRAYTNFLAEFPPAKRPWWELFFR
jgi:hypothetical protein